MKTAGIYVHIPFCRKKCEYCDFYSLPSPEDDAVNTYISALKLQMQLMRERTADYTFDTVFIGGGTPSLLSGKEMSELLDALRASFRITSDAEITAEANPATFDSDKLQIYRSSGINRLSIGIQSANENELRLLGRIHSEKQIKEAFDAAISANFDNINLDVMYGIPDQTLASFKKTLELVTELAPKHVSVYGLQLEPATPLYCKRDSLVFPDEDAEKALNRLALTHLSEAGYNRYEISNYAQNGYECKHNLKYWHGEEYIGLGVAAHSYLSGVRYNAPTTLDAYLNAVNSRNIHALQLEPNYICGEERAEEFIILRLRLTEGISKTEFEKATGADFSPYEKRILKFVTTGHIMKQGDRYSFTPEGFDLSNYILSSII